jgi:hypothetical protein
MLASEGDGNSELVLQPHLVVQVLKTEPGEVDYFLDT